MHTALHTHIARALSVLRSVPWRTIALRLVMVVAGLVPAATIIAVGAALASPTTHSFDRGFTPSPAIITGSAGGELRATRFGVTSYGPCRGWIPSEANHVIRLEQNFHAMRWKIEAPGDTTLLIQGPDGVRCADDAGGRDPQVEGEFPEGTYRVSVGSYTRGETIPYRLVITDLRAP